MIPLKPGELAVAFCITPPPEGYRWETDDEFRKRILKAYEQEVKT